MGGSTSTEAFDYVTQLRADNVSQSKERKVSGETKGETIPRVDNRVENDTLRVRPAEGITSLWHLVQSSVKKYPKNNMLGSRVRNEDGSFGDYVFESYETIDQQSRQVGAGLVSIGNKAGDNIGIFSLNRAEWVIAQQGIYSQSMRVVSLYATLGDTAVEYICNHAEIPTVVCSPENLPGLMNILSKISHQSEEGYLKNIIRMSNGPDDVASDEDIKTCQEAGVTLLDYSAVMTQGAEAKIEVNPPSEDDWAFIMYTSGTTGVPKGAILSHANLMATLSCIDTRAVLGEGDRHISYLPLAHIFETVVQGTMYLVGGSVGFFSGNIKNLTADMSSLRPTIFVGVPRVFDKMYKKIFGNVNSGNCGLAWYFNHAYEGTCDIVRVNGERDATWDSKVFDKVQAKMGLSETKLIITGAAPCAPYLMEFLKVVVGAKVIQGYGMTENAAAATVMNPEDPTVGHNGPPLPCCEVKLVDVDEMDYRSDNTFPEGEVWVRGANVFVGYYKNEKATQETKTADGWLKTGDIGRWNANGTLSIIDRKKNIFKLSQGEYVAAEKVEGAYAKSACVGQIFVYGNSYKSTILGIVVPDAGQVVDYLKEQKLWTAGDDLKLASPAFLAEYDKVCSANRESITNLVKELLKQQEGGLKGYEKVRDIYCEFQLDNQLQGFTEGNECLTPTFKLRRPYLLRRYLEPLQKMYAASGQPNRVGEEWPGAVAKSKNAPAAETKADSAPQEPVSAPAAEEQTADNIAPAVPEPEPEAEAAAPEAAADDVEAPATDDAAPAPDAE